MPWSVRVLNQSVSILLQLLDMEPELRGTIAFALYKRLCKDKEAAQNDEVIDRLKPLLADPDMEVRCWITHTLKRIGTEQAIDALFQALHELPAEELERSYLSRPTYGLLLDGLNQPLASAGEKLVSVFLSEGDRFSAKVQAYAMGVLGEFLECYRISLDLPESLVSQAEHYAFSGNTDVVKGAVKLLAIV
ncbi:HEAT repeat domain-containing protein (plasmid) [Synechococcus elongatus PCC 11801]|uniref:HEAT repeat domain-containing protein n=1 Tax=Synechococcus elongatus PCC 11801 TaxID=2219813 RepID=A0ACD5A391_SYNEL